MSNREITTQTRTFHPRALKTFGEDVCIIALGVANDLRSGAIPPERYDQVSWCGSACCIGGHIAERMNIPKVNPAGVYAAVRFWASDLKVRDDAIADLFSGFYQSATPQQAADAIENYIYHGLNHPFAKAMGYINRPLPRHEFAFVDLFDVGNRR